MVLEEVSVRSEGKLDCGCVGGINSEVPQVG